MKKIFSVDRFVGEYAVLVCDDGEVLTVKKEIISSFSEGDVFSAEWDGEKLSEIALLEGEKERRLEAAKSRLARFKSRSNS